MQNQFINIILYISGIVGAMITAGCGSHDSAVWNDDFQVYRMEQDLDDKSLDSNLFVQRYHDIIEVIYANDDIPVNYDDQRTRILQLPIVVAFKNKVDSVFADNSFIESNVLPVVNNWNAIDSVHKIQALTTVITPFNQSVMLGDTLVVLGLNHYLGKDEPLYGYFPDYLRKYKIPERISIDVAEALSKNLLGSRFGSIPRSVTLLDYMIYEGTVIKMMQRLLSPKIDVADILMWTDADIKNARANSHAIWNKIIGRDMLYSTSPQIINEIIDPVPAVYCLGDGVPPMIGRYLGYKIVDSYMQHNDDEKNLVKLYSDIIKQSPQRVLLKSKYDGR